MALFKTKLYRPLIINKEIYTEIRGKMKNLAINFIDFSTKKNPLRIQYQMIERINLIGLIKQKKKKKKKISSWII